MIAPPIIVYATIVCPVTYLCQEKAYRGQYLFVAVHRTAFFAEL